MNLARVFFAVLRVQILLWARNGFVDHVDPKDVVKMIKQNGRQIDLLNRSHAVAGWLPWKSDRNGQSLLATHRFVDPQNGNEDCFIRQGAATN
jgi:hypothetical protein